MSTRTRSRSSSRRASRHAAGGFTLIELLVVVAIIAMLMSILLPSLSAAKEAARAAVCGQRLRDLATGLHTYATENIDFIPGINTTGIVLEQYSGPDYQTAFYNARNPVQTYDWITPILALNTELPAIRAERFKEILTTFACPSQRFDATTFYGGAQDSQDFQNAGEWRPVSYLMPIHFQFWGQQQEGMRIAQHMTNPNASIFAKVADDQWEVVVENYRSLITQVGTPAQKVAAADGTRYLTDTKVIDFDIDAVPGLFGAFTSSGAWWGGSTAYGVKSGTPNWSGRRMPRVHSPAQGDQMALSYRHGMGRGSGSGSCVDNRGTMNAMFFDGSVQRLNDRQSRNPVYWYPRGAKVQIRQEGLIDDLQNGDLIP